MIKTKLQELSSIDVFQDLTRQDLEEMERSTRMSTCEPGRVFYAPAEQGEVLFLLKKGRVQLYRLSSEGKKLVVAVLDEGAVFGEMSLIGRGMHNTFAEALEECILCVMSRDDVVRLIHEKPMVGIRFMESLASRLQAAEDQLEALAFKGIPSRLSSLLLNLASPQEDAWVVEGYTHQDFAEMLGTYRETTTQILNHFKNAGVIDIERKRIVLLDRETLVMEAGSQFEPSVA